MTGLLGGYQDWPDAVAALPVLDPGHPVRGRLASVLGVRRAVAQDLRVDAAWEGAGTRTCRVSWALPYGPRTTAYVVAPTEPEGRLPGVLMLHCHAGTRSTGAQQLLDVAGDPDSVGAGARQPAATVLRDRYYGGRAPATELARRGAVVLVHDAFSWASRRFTLDHPPAVLGERADALVAAAGRELAAYEREDLLHGLHEDHLAKAAGALGTSLAGAVVTDDLAALDILADWPGVDPDRIGVAGFSGGGGRAAYLAALDPRVRSVVVTCMMATFASLVPEYLASHSWLLFSPGLPAVFDLPDLLTIDGGVPTLVQYAELDELFPLAGMRAASRTLASRLGVRYTGSFHATGHAYPPAMQREAEDHLLGSLAGHPRFPAHNPRASGHNQ